MTFNSILAKYRELAFSERDKGNRFERLMQAYLRTDPKYDSLFEHVWLWEEFEGRQELGGQDTGIDLVAITEDGEYWAIQCKCYQESARIDKSEVDSFLATSSRTFHDKHGVKHRFAHRLWISTTNKWGANATEAIQNQDPPVTRLNLFDLLESPVDWEALDNGIHGEQARTPKKNLYPHQRDALRAAHEHLSTHDRGKLIMACGTGKTFTALKIAEHETHGKGLVLFLVPSIALLGQTLREWSADAVEPINAVCICSDPKITRSKKKEGDSDYFSIVDLALPASTDPEYILHQFEHIRQSGKPGMTVVFSTYQSIEVIASVQQRIMDAGFGAFDLIICDEAHRTTGVTLSDEDESSFVKVHDDDFLKAKKRIYMTATPRLFSDEAQSKAAEADAVLCSMDDPRLYGEEFYRIGFGEAVERNLLTDYKVLILTLNDKDVPPAVQAMLSDGRTEIDTDDLSKLIGTINALSKQFIGDDGETKETDPEPMKRAVAFCPTIRDSKQIAATYNKAAEVYLDSLPEASRREMVTVSAMHMDGTMPAPERDEMLAWLKSDVDDNECRVITNVRVLSEGVDVPSLDAVLFLSARNSQVDVVQSVGRVMRRAKGKKYGYIVIPVVVPSDVSPEEALNDNARFKVVWTVLNALRAHDDRFNATINKIELNRKKPTNIITAAPNVSFDGDDGAPRVRQKEDSQGKDSELGKQLAMRFEQIQSVMYARMVKKVGDRRYWEQWAKDIAILAERQIERIKALIETRTSQRQAFDEFLEGLQKNINPSIDEDQAVEMLAQHIITRPVFEALFEGYSFVESNAVSIAMQGVLEKLEGKSVAEESEQLQRFYESVRKRAEGIDNAEGKQRIIVELYDTFFKTAFPRLVEQLGIVYTPVEVVDFIIKSVNDVLRQEFASSISSDNIHIIDPFVGTGTFISRILHSGLIDKADLIRKYKHELHANEIVLLAYYIAAVNIENSFHDLVSEITSSSDPSVEIEYEAFEGIVLTDTFQLGESDSDLYSEMFPQNSDRVVRQLKAPIRVIIGNPPYSVGQKSINDNAPNQDYPRLNERISSTYAAYTTASNKNALYDSYLRAFRWSADRLSEGSGGIIGFVTNGSWIDGSATAGFRNAIEKEFTSIWVLNTRGNARTSGELRKKEAGNVFGSGSRAPIAITLLVKNPKSDRTKAQILYHDIGDYLSREEKLKMISELGSVSNPEMNWKLIEPNEHGDWIGKRSGTFPSFTPLYPGKKFWRHSASWFVVNSRGIETSRDAWAYDSSRRALSDKVRGLIAFYNEQLKLLQKRRAEGSIQSLDKIISYDESKISWSSSLISCLERGEPIEYEHDSISTSLYRPFFKQLIYRGSRLVHRLGQSEQMFPYNGCANKVICVSGIGSKKRFSAIITNVVPDVQLMSNCQCFPLYYYEQKGAGVASLFGESEENKYSRKSGISEYVVSRVKDKYGIAVGEEAIFFYVYGLLHHPQFIESYENDLRLMLPHVPLVDEIADFWALSQAGEELASLHLDYEMAPPFEHVSVSGEQNADYRIKKMRFGKKKGINNGKKGSVVDRAVLFYNSKIVVTGIPSQAYRYVVNGRSAIEWLIDRYQIRTDKKSGIVNDPNNWAEETGNPRYVLDLLLSVITVSMKTVEIIEGLPILEFDAAE